MDSYKKELIESGLSESQATVYEFLIRNGSTRASNIVRKLGGNISRPMVYAVLNELISLGLVEKNELDTKVARFSPTHPTKLQDVAERRREAADAIASAASRLIPRIVSDYNLVSGKPGVRFFEGRNCIRAVLQDSLAAKTPILSYTDVEVLETHYKDVSDEYLKDREQKGILKKLLLDDTPFVRELYRGSEESYSEVRLIPLGQNPFKVAMQIYDDKVSYLTLNPGKEMGIIIQDTEISSLQRHLFEELYHHGAPLYIPAVASGITES